jgi:hypothetical protein
MNTYEEQRLREALDGEARRATGTVTWDQVLRRRGTRQHNRHKWLVPGLAAAAVVAVAVMIAVISGSPDAQVASPRTSGSTSVAPSPEVTGEIVSSTPAFPDPRSVPATMITDYRPGIAPDTVSIGWALNEDLLVVTTFGSGSCPKLIDKVTAETGNSIRLEITSGNPTRTCTADLRPLTSTIRPPAGITADQTLVVRIGSREWQIPPRG